MQFHRAAEVVKARTEGERTQPEICLISLKGKRLGELLIRSDPPDPQATVSTAKDQNAYD